MRKRIALLCMLGCAASMPGAWGTVDTSSPEASASTDTPTSFAAAPAVAAGSYGAVVVWQQLDTAGGTGWDIFARRYDSSGNPLAGPIAVTQAGGCQRNPAVAIDPAGNFLVVWESESHQVLARLFRASDAMWTGAEIVVASDATLRRMLPAVAAVPSAPPAIFLVAWQGEGEPGDTSGFGVAARLVTAGVSGSTLLPPVAAGGPDLLIPTSTLGAQIAPVIAFAPNFRTYPGYTGGRFVVAWQSSGGSSPGVYRRLVTTGGALDGAEVLTSAVGAQTAEPAIAADASGNYTIAWRQARTDGAFDIRFHRFPNGTERSANAVALRRRTRPAVAAIGSGDFAVTWDSEPQDPDGRGVYSTFLDPTELPVLSELVVNTTTTGDQEAARAAATYGGTVLTAWQGPVPLKNSGIWTRPLRIAHNFYTLSPCRLLDTRNPNGPLGGPALVANAVRTFTLTGTCAVPASASALSLNVTMVPSGSGGAIVAYPGDAPTTETSTLSFNPSQVRANNAVLQLSADGTGKLSVKLLSPASAHVIIDVNGYFQ